MAGMLNFRYNDASQEGQEEESSRIIRVSIDEIDTSHVNPRKTRGEHYESTKQSIKNIGLQSMLTITKLPDAERYSLYNGGNTRLTILKELAEEYMATGETDKANALRWQECRYVPYTDDLDLLIKHMAENEERSGMTFIDKARAVFRIRELYLKQTGEDDVSNSKLIQYIHSLGWTRVNRPVIVDLRFAYDELEAVIPFALEAGMGKLKVNQLRTWLNQIDIYIAWLVETYGYDYSVERARQLYFAVLSEYDDDLEPIDLDLFFEAYRYRLSDVLRQFDPMLTSIRIDVELQTIAETGEPIKEVDPQELIRRLEATTDMRPAEFPTPRKPRSPSAPKADPETAETETDTASFTHTGTGTAETAAGTNPETHAAPVTSSGYGLVEGTPELMADIARRKQQDSGPKIRMPFGPDVALPSDNLPLAEYNAQIRETAQALYRMVLERYDSHGALTQVISFDASNILTQQAPYCSIDLEDTDAFDALAKTLEIASDPERFAILSVLSVWDFYIRHLIDINPESQTSALRAQKLMLDWRQRYNDYQSWCRVGLVTASYEQAQALIDIEILSNQLLGLLHAVETYALSAEV